MNYGAMGWILGHELTHGFYHAGSKIDATGNKVDWWESVAKDNFWKNHDCIIRQYGNYGIEKTGSNVSIVTYTGAELGLTRNNILVRF